jgi:hypothetical protein
MSQLRTAIAWNPPQCRDVDAKDLGLTWHVHDEDQPAFHLYHGNLYVAEVYGLDTVDGPAFRWVSKVTDWRQIAPTLDEAKRQVVADYHRHAVLYTDEVATMIEAARDRIGPPSDPL